MYLVCLGVCLGVGVVSLVMCMGVVCLVVGVCCCLFGCLRVGVWMFMCECYLYDCLCVWVLFGCMCCLFGSLCVGVVCLVA